MTLILTVIHILVCLALIFVVLLQRNAAGDMGTVFGGSSSSQSIFGARGSGSFLGKLTAGLATVFMLTSLSLAFITSQSTASRSVMEGAAPVTTPAVPAESMPPKEAAPPAPAPAAPGAETPAPAPAGEKPVPMPAAESAAPVTPPKAQ